MKFLDKIYEKNKESNNISKTDILYLNFLHSLVLLFPLFLLTGPFIPDLTIVLCSISFLYLAIKYKISLYFNNFFFKIFFIFWIYLSFASLLSDNILFSLKSSFFYFRFIVFSLFIYFLIKNYNYFLKFFFYTLSITLMIILIDSYFQFYSGYSLTGFEKPNLRLTGPFGDRQIVGSFISRILPLYLFLFYCVYEKINLKIIIFIIFLSILVLFSGERTAFFILTFFIFSVLFLFNKKFINTLMLMIVYTFISLLIVFTVPSLKKRFVEQTLQGFAIKNFSNEVGVEKYFNEKPKRGFYIFSRAHEVHYLTAFSMFKDSPIFGQGPNMYRKKCSDKNFFIEQSSCTTHPHNFLLQVLAETGLIGAIFYLMILFILLSKILSLLYNVNLKNINLTKKQLNLYILNLGFIINIFIFILPNGNFFNNYLNAIIFIPVGFYLFQNEK